ncbi:MAG: hypothetical protein WCV58_04590, partial [Patescibacteria group bacterium]
MLKLNSIRKKFLLIIFLILLVVLSVGTTMLVKGNINQTRKDLSEGAIAFSQLSTKPLAEMYTLYFNSGYIKFRELFLELRELDPNISKIQIID